jgi:F0F1-type ATP synthase beta subunit
MKNLNEVKTLLEKIEKEAYNNYKEGKSLVAAQNKLFFDSLENLPVGSKTFDKMFKAWTTGIDKATKEEADKNNPQLTAVKYLLSKYSATDTMVMLLATGMDSIDAHNLISQSL